MLECFEEQTESNSMKDKGRPLREIRVVDNMEKSDKLNGEICKAVTIVLGVYTYTTNFIPIKNLFLFS